MKNQKLSTDIQTYFDALRLKLAYRISYTFLVVFSSLSVAYSFEPNQSFISMLIGFIISLFCVIICHTTQKFKVVFYAFSIAGVAVASFALIFFYQTIHFSDVLWMLAAVALAFFGLGRKVGVVLLTVTLIAIVIFVFYALNTHIEAVVPVSFEQKFGVALELAFAFGVNFYLFNLFVNVYRYSSKKLEETNNKLQDQNIEKSILVKEVHHRVKNNLQIVVSLLRLQSAEIDSANVKSHYDRLINRVMAMALVHQKLYQNESLSQVKLSNYAKDLADNILKTYSQSESVHFIFHSTIEKVGLKSLIPIGLILNELISNSLKHAFSNKQESETINCTVLDNSNKSWLTIHYKDNGKWDNAAHSEKGFGLVLIQTLVDQLEGEMNIEHKENGVQFTIKVKNIEEPDFIS